MSAYIVHRTPQILGYNKVSFIISYILSCRDRSGYQNGAMVVAVVGVENFQPLQTKPLQMLKFQTVDLPSLYPLCLCERLFWFLLSTNHNHCFGDDYCGLPFLSHNERNKRKQNQQRRRRVASYSIVVKRRVIASEFN